MAAVTGRAPPLVAQAVPCAEGRRSSIIRRHETHPSASSSLRRRERRGAGSARHDERAGPCGDRFPGVGGEDPRGDERHAALRGRRHRDGQDHGLRLDAREGRGRELEADPLDAGLRRKERTVPGRRPPRGLRPDADRRLPLQQGVRHRARSRLRDPLRPGGRERLVERRPRPALQPDGRHPRRPGPRRRRQRASRRLRRPLPVLPEHRLQRGGRARPRLGDLPALLRPAEALDRRLRGGPEGRHAARHAERPRGLRRRDRHLRDSVYGSKPAARRTRWTAATSTSRGRTPAFAASAAAVPAP